MPMFPLQPRPFAALRVSPEQCIEYETMAMAVLHETLAEYHTFAHRQQRKINKKRWKEVKTRENVTVYKCSAREDIVPGLRTSGRTNSTSSNNSSGSDGWSNDSRNSATSAKQWPLPKLLGVGTIVGTLEDVMYGNLSPELDSFLIKTVYMEDELVDAELLNVLRSPSHEDPFQCVSLQWFVKGHSMTINTMVKPRDLVYVRAQGIYLDPSTGEKIGYHVMHSLDHPDYPPLTAQGIIRGSMSSCYLYRQLSNGTVELYMKALLDLGGYVPDTIALITAANGLIGCWKAVWCAQNKKLAWLLKDAVERRQRTGDDGSVKVKMNAKNKQCCSLCLHSFSTFRRAVVCELCRAVVCSKCRTVRKLAYVQQHDTVRVATPFCNPCITLASEADATKIAIHEYVEGDSSGNMNNSGGTTEASGTPYPKGDSTTSAPSLATTVSIGGTTSDFAASHGSTESVDEVDTIEEWEARNRVPTEYMRPSAVFARKEADNGDENNNNAGTPTAAARYPLQQTGRSSQEYMTNDIRNDKQLIAFRIDQKEVTLRKSIARGGYGVIYRGLYKGVAVAVKQMLPDAWRNEKKLTRFMDEIRLCASLHHPKIVQFVGITWTSLRDLSVVIEYMAGGDLQNVLYKHAQSLKPLVPSPLEWMERWTTAALNNKTLIARDVAEAVVYLHSFHAQIVHRDLKAKNVLLDKHGNAKLSDFGISREVNLEETMTSEVGTSAWIAPEVLRGDRYDEKADIYSLGVLLVELDRCSHPYAGEEPLMLLDGNTARRPGPPSAQAALPLTNMQIAMLVSSGRLQPSPTSACPSRVKQLIRWCLKFTPHDRPSAMQVHYELRQMLAMP